MIFQGTRAELLVASAPDVVITCSDPYGASAALGYLNARVNQAGEVTVSGLDDQQTAGVVASLVGERIGVYGVRRDEQTLEDVFMRLTAGGQL